MRGDDGVFGEGAEEIHRRVDDEMSRFLRTAKASEPQKVALACRILARDGHAQSLAGQVTVRAGGETFWTTHFARGLRDATASSLVRFDRDMNVLEGDGMPNPAVRFHLWIYANRPDVQSIVHTHPPHVSALSMLARPLEVAHMDAMMLYENCAFLSEWPGVPIANEEGRIICEALGEKPAILLAHHGLLTVGDCVERATYLAVAMENAARLQLLAQAAGEIRAPRPELAREACAFLNKRSIVDATFAYWAGQIAREQPDVMEQERAMSESTPEHTAKLAAVNRKILAEGEVLPVVKLSDGTGVQTGTVATMLHNIDLYNAGARGEIERELELSVPTLFKVGLFRLFGPEHWIVDDNPGRQFVGEKARAFLAGAREK